MTLAVTDGALDHGMSRARAAVGRAAEAEARLQQALGGRCEPDWFTVGFTVDDQLAGYVVPALVGDDRPVLAEIGVAQPHRGQGYVHDLLAHGTQLLADYGAAQIRADTDLGNRPMRAAFARAGYREFAQRFDYRWARAGGYRAGAAAQLPVDSSPS